MFAQIMLRIRKKSPKLGVAHFKNSLSILMEACVGNLFYWQFD